MQGLKEVDPVSQGVFYQSGNAKTMLLGSKQDMVENAK
jgi:hypothetical protein